MFFLLLVKQVLEKRPNRRRRRHFPILNLCLRPKNVIEKFREVSDSVWVSFEAVIIEKTIKEEWTNKNNFYDNYN